MIMTLWTIGALATFGLFCLVDIPGRALARLALEDATMPLWALQVAISGSCALLWPLMLLLLAADFARGQ